MDDHALLFWDSRPHLSEPKEQHHAKASFTCHPRLSLGQIGSLLLFIFCQPASWRKGFLFSLVYLLLISFINYTKEWFLLYVHMYYNTPTVLIHFFWWLPCDYLIVNPSSVFIWCSKLTCDRKHVVLLCVCLIFFLTCWPNLHPFSGKCPEFFLMGK